MENRDYLALDMEMTGLNPKSERILEIGCVLVRNGEITDDFQVMINPSRKLSDHIIELTGITDEMASAGVSQTEGMEMFLEFVKKNKRKEEKIPLLGHRILFDFSFLKRQLLDAALIVEAGKKKNEQIQTMETLGIASGIDTLRIARAFLPKLPSKSLPALCEYYGIHEEAHRALNDAIAAHSLYQIFLNEFGENQDAEKIFAPVPLICKLKKQQPITKKSKERLLELLQRHHIEPSYELDSLTRNEADREIDRILSKYGNTIKVTENRGL